MTTFLKHLVIIILVSISSLLQAQIEQPVKWSFRWVVAQNESTEKAQDNITKAEILFIADIIPSWSIYGTDLPDDGPISTTFTFEKLEHCTLLGNVRNVSQSIEYYDDIFKLVLHKYEQKAVFTQGLLITDIEHFNIEGYVNFMACSKEVCLPPTSEEFRLNKYSLENSEAISDLTNLQTDTATTHSDSIPTALLSDLTSNESLWTPVIDELKQFVPQEKGENASLWWLFIYGFLGGLLALVTPCVWPIIPMTVSFFLKRTRDRKKAIGDALIYGISIVVIYVLLGLAITLIFGASALNSLATNAVFNLLFFALLVAFSLSFFGLFEMVLPASWVNKMDQKADSSSGIWSMFFMAFTLVLVSFSCTGPIIGTLLVEAATKGSLLGPTIGMLGFALALALPFSLFAVFPHIMQSLPQSGGWLNSVKVVLGFLELAFSLKFLSVADLAYGWGIMPREIFILLWILIFASLGLYLLNVIRFHHEEKKNKLPILRIVLAIVSFGFSIYMIPGLLGAPLKSISAFAPPMSTQRINLFHQEVKPDFYDYEEGMAYAQAHQKNVVLDFSGYGCVNCRKMENAVWQHADIKEMLQKEYVLISLMVDDKTPMPSTLSIEEFGKQRKIRTVGDKWSYLQRYKFGANAQPFYVILTPEGRPLSAPYSYNDNADDFYRFLKR